MEANNNTGGYPSSMKRAGFGVMTQTMDNYNQETRQRKYMIEELEATVDNLEKELNQWREQNKNLEQECEKLQMAAAAAEINYEKKVKEKTLMEKDMRELWKEMDEINAQMIRRKANLQQLETFHKEKVELCKKKEQQYKKEYMKNPDIAKVMENAKKAKEVEDILKEKQNKLKRRLEEKEMIKNKHDLEWEAFKKKCVKLAEADAKLRDKKKLLKSLNSQYETALKIHKPSERDLRSVPQQPQASIPGLSARYGASGLPKTPFLMDALGSKVGVAVPPQRRSSAFQQLDRLLRKAKTPVEPSPNRFSNWTPLQQGTVETTTSSWKNLCSPLNKAPATSLVSQIRSKLKGTALPILRSQENPKEEPMEVSTEVKVPNVASSTSGSGANETLIIPQGPKKTTITSTESTLAVQPPADGQIKGPTTSSNDDLFVRPRTPPPIQPRVLPSEPMETNMGSNSTQPPTLANPVTGELNKSNQLDVISESNANAAVPGPSMDQANAPLIPQPPSQDRLFCFSPSSTTPPDFTQGHFSFGDAFNSTPSSSSNDGNFFGSLFGGPSPSTSSSNNFGLDWLNM